MKSTSNFFSYQKTHSEINELLAESEAFLENKPALKHFWTIYDRVSKYEYLSEELKEHLYDITLEIPSSLGSNKVGFSQSLLNINQAQGLLEIASAAYEKIITILRNNRQIAIRANNIGVYNNKDIDLFELQFQNNLNEITRIAKNTRWNNLLLIEGTYEKFPLIFQIGINNTMIDRDCICLRDVTSPALGLVNSCLTKKLNNLKNNFDGDGCTNQQESDVVEQEPDDCTNQQEIVICIEDEKKTDGTNQQEADVCINQQDQISLQKDWNNDNFEKKK